jgi:hypothetical protein
MSARPDKFTVTTFYWKVMNEYLDAIEQLTDLYDNNKTPGAQDFVFAETRMRAASDKIRYTNNIARTSYGYDLGPVFPYLRRGGTA